MLASLLVLVAVTVVRSQELPPICCFDKQYTAVLSDIGGFYGGNNNNDLSLIDAGTVSAYDFYSQRQASGSFAAGNNEYNSTIEIFELRDWRRKLHYRKFGRFGNCTTEPLRTGKMPPPCIPGNATWVSNSTLGYGRSRLDIQVYEFDAAFSETLDAGRIKMGVTKDCIPVIHFLTGTVNGTFFEMNLFYTSYHPGIQNVHAFDLADDCRTFYHPS